MGRDQADVSQPSKVAGVRRVMNVKHEYDIQQRCKENTATFWPVEYPAVTADRKEEGHSERDALLLAYRDKLFVNPRLSRNLVSFQANKARPVFRWFRYKEGFSHSLVRWLLKELGPRRNGSMRVLDPFCGAGTTVLTAIDEGWDATGIELLPVAQEVLKAGLAARRASVRSLKYHITRIAQLHLTAGGNGSFNFPHLRITRGAFPPQTEKAISAYVDYLRSVDNADTRYLLWFACLCCLEEVSYTRKDGQYLRWDSRSPRKLRSQFNKGDISDFRTAVLNKLWTITHDISLLQKREGITGKASMVCGSCLEQLPLLADGSFDLVVTSPPYCNRYDYTRTYALELAFLGCSEDQVRELRQALLSATVENKSKRDRLRQYFASIQKEPRFAAAEETYENQQALQEVLDRLYEAKAERALNNANIPDMVANYFFEMNLVVRELARVLAPGGRIAMINDNVRYHGQEVPVDLILSDFASSAGLEVDKIWVLPRGKGNSSQQMGAHGRQELRKCVYIWSKT